MAVTRIFDIVDDCEANIDLTQSDNTLSGLLGGGIELTEEQLQTFLDAVRQLQESGTLNGDEVIEALRQQFPNLNIEPDPNRINSSCFLS